MLPMLAVPALKMLLEASPKPVKPDSGYGITVGGKYEGSVAIMESGRKELRR